MKGIVVYYSLSEKTHAVAAEIGKQLGFDLLRLKPKKEIESSKFSKYMWGGLSVLMKKEPELEPFNFNANEYDVIVIGTPVWAWTYAPAIKTFTSTFASSIKNKKIVLFTSFGGNPGKTVEHMKTALDGNTFIYDQGFCDKTKDDVKTVEIQTLINNIKEKS